MFIFIKHYSFVVFVCCLCVALGIRKWLPDSIIVAS